MSDSETYAQANEHGGNWESHLAEVKTATATSAQAPESGWLIERGGLCVGFCERKFAWVSFTNDQAWRFARKSDATRFIEAYGGLGLHDVLVTEHRWGL